ncbi:hypothetical protein BZA05DRAFT_420799 [Tricharina praecox]|uniref:uncharacterized protein n=1 Tax=Tricharina praecox TaxID=43433 RepID=UPI00221E76CD|nr:uncharacterized protein BZA05DRAFT_420799 [Tricharina praecox]KAI5846977.1 hypothetical protein BZA05DRAFT_420799 [Tricharina praecox]
MCELKACIYDLCCHRGLAPPLETCKDADTCREHAKANLKKLDFVMPKAPGYCPSCLKRASKGQDLIPHTTPRVGDVLDVNRLRYRLSRGPLAGPNFGSRPRPRPLLKPPARPEETPVRRLRPRTRRAAIGVLTTPNASSAIKPYDAGDDAFLSSQDWGTPTKSSQTSLPHTPSSVAPPLPPTGKKRRHRVTLGKPIATFDCPSSPIITPRPKRVKGTSSSSSSKSSGSSGSSSTIGSTATQKRCQSHRSRA